MSATCILIAGQFDAWLGKAGPETIEARLQEVGRGIEPLQREERKLDRQLLKDRQGVGFKPIRCVYQCLAWSCNMVAATNLSAPAGT